MEKHKKSILFLRTIIGTCFILIITILLIWGKVQLFITLVPGEAVDYSIYLWYLIPVMYIVDYFKYAGISSTFAFLLSGIIQEFIPQNTILMYLGPGKYLNYFIVAF